MPHPLAIQMVNQCTEEPSGLQSMGCKELDVTEHAHTHTLNYGNIFRMSVSILEIQVVNCAQRPCLA